MPLAALPTVRLNWAQLPARIGPDLADGPADHVVMIHGLAANMAFWYVVAAQALTRVGPVTLYDLRGHGYSDMPPSGYSARTMADDLAQLLDVVGIREAHIIAHSFGGSVALRFAAAFPERVKSLILADVRVRAVEPQLRLSDWRGWPALERRLRALGVDIDPDHPEAGIQIVTTLARLQVEAPEVGDAVNGLMIRGGARLFGTKQARRWLKLLATTAAAEEVTEDPLTDLSELAQIRLPVLALFGQYSMSLASGRALAAHCPDCTLEIIPRAGHFFPLTRPRLFARSSLDFLAKHARISPPVPPVRLRRPRPRARAGGLDRPSA